MIGSCRFEGCTVNETGICALERDPATCANRLSEGNTPNSPNENVEQNNLDRQTLEQLGAPVLTQPERMSAFGSSQSLGLGELNTLMGKRYVNVVGILGDPESGKTACLASLYLLVSHAKLEGWAFADSKSLAAFEDIARGARDWNDGNVPQQMTVHTELKDEHSPGFLHLRLKRRSDGRRVDLALPDIPGEWTQALVTSARSDRLDFLKSVEVVWIVLDGRVLANIEKRQGLIARMGQLAARLTSLYEGHLPRLIMVVTHRDSYAISPDIASRIQAELAKRGCTAEIIGVAPFSDKPDDVPAGFGISELIDRTVGISPKQPVFWKSTPPNESTRTYLSYRRSQ